MSWPTAARKSAGGDFDYPDGAWPPGIFHDQEPRGAFMRTVLFHIGGPKTGSSALQIYFSANAARLKRKGVSYRHSPSMEHSHEVTSGNGYLVAEAVLEGRTDTATLSKLLASYFDRRSDRALISSESLARFSSENWRELGRACALASLQPTVLMFVRDVYPFYVSAYHQAVKRHGEHRSFVRFVDENSIDYHSDMLRKVTDGFGRDVCKVAHYESRRSALDVPVLAQLDLQGDFDRSALTRKVNRRLTDRELHILRMVNGALGTHYSEEVSNKFIYDRPNARTEETIDHDALRVIRLNREECVTWLNREFFDNRPTVKLLDFDKKQAAANGHEPATPTFLDWLDLPEAQVAEWAVERFGRLRNALVGELRDRIAVLVRDRSFADHPDIPSDFDPCAYLLLNEDLLINEVPPYEHFARRGRIESRAYRF
jgi:hypothetical protein